MDEQGRSRAVDQMVQYGNDAMLRGGMDRIKQSIENGAAPHYAAGSMVGELLFQLESSVNRSGRRLTPQELRQSAQGINRGVGELLHEAGLLNVKTQQGATNFATMSMAEAVGTYGRHVKQAQAGGQSAPAQVGTNA